MLKYRCLVLDHDDTVVQTEKAIGYPYFRDYIARVRPGKNLTNQLIRLVLLVMVALGAVTLVYSLPIFDGIRERMDSLLAGIFGGGQADGSTLLRMRMIELGWDWFLKHPISGIGIGNGHILAARYLGKDTYLHNNFVELLCGGGIFGFLAYYSMYIYLFRNLLKYRDADRRQFEICFVWLLLMLFLDYGMVSYITKIQWFYLLVHFLNVRNMKSRYVKK